MAGTIQIEGFVLGTAGPGLGVLRDDGRYPAGPQPQAQAQALVALFSCASKTTGLFA